MIHKIVLPTPFAVGDVNAFLVKGDALSLFDAGPKTPEAYEVLKYGLKQAGYTFKDIEQVFLTHHHPDHSGWVEAFDNAKLYGHAYNDFWLKRDEDFFAYHDTFYMDRFVEQGVPEKYLKIVPKMKYQAFYIGERALDYTLAEGDEVPGHPGWTALETPGHAQSHLAFWHERNSEMIGGDLVLEKVSSNPLIEPPMDRNAERPRSLLQYNASLQRVADLSIDKIYGGHGAEVTNIRPLIEKRLLRQKERAMKVYDMLADGPKTAFDLTKMLFPTAYEKELGLTLSETVGQVDDLINRELIYEIKKENGVLLYEQR